MYVCVHMCVRTRVYVFVCVRERKRVSERATGRKCSCVERRVCMRTRVFGMYVYSYTGRFCERKRVHLHISVVVCMHVECVHIN